MIRKIKKIKIVNIKTNKMKNKNKTQTKGKKENIKIKISPGMELGTAVAHAIQQCNINFISSYPITPQTLMVEKLSKFKAEGNLKAEFVNVESEHSSMSACIGASASGSRVFTATSSQGLMYMAEMLPIASGLRLPIVMANANRAISSPINIWNDQSDSMFVKDAGWIQIYCESVQEVYDTLIQSYKIAENENVLLPIMVCLDGFYLSHVLENVSLLEDKEVLNFVGTFDKKRLNKLDIEKPKTIGHVASPEYYYQFKKEQDIAMKNANKIIEKVHNEFKNKFSRGYGDGFIEDFETKNKETLFISLGSISSTIKSLIIQNKINAGLLRIRTFIPFPYKKIKKIISNKKIKKIIVIDRSLSLGLENPVYSEIKKCLLELNNKNKNKNSKKIKNFVLGLGGKNVLDEELIDIAKNFDKYDEVTIL